MSNILVLLVLNEILNKIYCQANYLLTKKELLTQERRKVKYLLGKDFYFGEIKMFGTRGLKWAQM